MPRTDWLCTRETGVLGDASREQMGPQKQHKQVTVGTGRTLAPPQEPGLATLGPKREPTGVGGRTLQPC